MRLFRDQHAHGVGPHKTSYDWKQVDIGPGRNFESQITGFDVERIMKSRYKRGPAELFRIDTEKEMMHAGIPNTSHVDNLLFADACLKCDIQDHLV